MPTMSKAKLKYADKDRLIWQRKVAKFLSKPQPSNYRAKEWSVSAIRKVSRFESEILRFLAVANLLQTLLMYERAGRAKISWGR